MSRAPTVADLDRMAREAFGGLPEEARAVSGDVVIRVEEFADAETLAELGMEDPFDLTGLYEGVPLTERSHEDATRLPPLIRLFRRAILEEWIERGDVDLSHLVKHVLVHELAHHLGWSDADIAAVDDWTL